MRASRRRKEAVVDILSLMLFQPRPQYYSEVSPEWNH
jgi:hypothetical protein